MNFVSKLISKLTDFFKHPKQSDFNISIRLDSDFVKEISKLIKKNCNYLSKLNGLSKNQLSYTEFIDNFIDKHTVADASVDGNANVKTKDICTLEHEMNKPHSKLLSWNKLFYEMKKKWGLNDAIAWTRSEYFGQSYAHDFPSLSQKSYCFAYDLDELVNKGLYFIDGFNAQPPKHLYTYNNFVMEFVSWTSNRTSGACGLPSFLIYSYYFWKKDVENGDYVRSPEYYRDQHFQDMIYRLNQPYVRISQSAFTNFTIYDVNYLVELFGGKQFPDGSFIIDHVNEILEYQKAFMRVLGDIRSQNAMTFPVMTYSLLYDYKREKFVDEDFAKWCCGQNMRWGDSNFYVSDSADALSNCCRLVSNIDNIGYFNSIGGTGLRVGSVKVNTINLARIAYECENKDEYFKVLKDRVILANKFLYCVRHTIKRNVEKGLLPNYKMDIVNFNNQYNTIGIIGVYEALEKYGLIVTDKFGYCYYTPEGMEFAKKILNVIEQTNAEFKKENNIEYNINIEQIPAERAAAVLQYKDKIFFPNQKYTLPLYGNQWIPLGVKTTLKEKIRISSILDKACSAGAISHFNVATPFKSFEEAWKALNYVAKSGCVYFAFCYRISICKHNHSFFGQTCPICGESVMTYVRRIVGFLVPWLSYSAERKAEDNLRTEFETDAFME